MYLHKVFWDIPDAYTRTIFLVVSHNKHVNLWNNPESDTLCESAWLSSLESSRRSYLQLVTRELQRFGETRLLRSWETTVVGVVNRQPKETTTSLTQYSLGVELKIVECVNFLLLSLI